MTGGLLDYTILNEARLGLQFPNGSATIAWQDEHDEWRPDFERGCCTAGDTLNLSTTESLPQPFVGFGGELVFGSVIYSVTKLSFSVVASRDIIVPVLREGEFRSFSGIPFTFRGRVTGSAPDRRTLALDLIGSGHATTVVEHSVSALNRSWQTHITTSRQTHPHPSRNQERGCWSRRGWER